MASFCTWSLPPVPSFPASLPPPPSCSAVAWEWFSLHQTPLHLDHPVHRITFNMSLPAQKPFFDCGIKSSLDIWCWLQYTSMWPCCSLYQHPAICRNPSKTSRPICDLSSMRSPWGTPTSVAAAFHPHWSLGLKASFVARVHKYGSAPSPRPCPQLLGDPASSQRWMGPDRDWSTPSV